MRRTAADKARRVGRQGARPAPRDPQDVLDELHTRAARHKAAASESAKTVERPRD